MRSSSNGIRPLLVLLAITSSLYAQPRRLDDFASANRWEADPSDGVAMEISAEPGKSGRALRIDFDFGGGGGYAIARLPLQIDLPENYELSFLLRGETPVNTLELKLLDATRENVWWSVRRHYRFPEEWTRVRFKKRHLNFAWGPQGGGDIARLSAIEIVVTAAEGGKGTIWIDDLTFAPLEPERPYDITPSVRASSTLPSHPAAHVLDGDFSTSWRSAAQGKQDFEIDFLRRRELGGLVIDWDESGFAVDYDVLLSIDGETWDRAWRVRDGDGGRDYVILPEAEARFVRVELQRGDGDRFGIREIDVQEPQFSETKNAMFEQMAASARRGLYPRYLSRVQSYWTIVGAPEDPREALINEEGMIDVDPVRFSLDPFLEVDGQEGSEFLTWADAREITQSLESRELPIPTVVRDHGDIRLSITTFARGEAGHSVLWARYAVENLANTGRNATLHVAIRPLQVNPSWQFLAVQGGSAEILSLERKGAHVVVNDTTSIIPLTEPSLFGAMRFDQGEVVEGLAEGRAPSATSVEDPFGSASGVMSWSLALSPGERREVVVTVPFHGRPADLDGGLTMSGAARIAERELAVSRAEWANRLGRVRIHLPESASHISRAIRTNLAYILINMDGPSIQPGSRSYDRSWIRDGSLTSAALLRLAHPEEVRRFIEWYAKYQRESGYVPCCVSARGGDPVPENDSHGQFIYLIREYFDFTGDRTLLDQMWPHVRKAVEYIDTLRHQRMTDEYRQPEKLAFYGLVPESISHEGYSAKPMHSYWDDFFTLKGLVDATEIARLVGADEEHAAFARIRDEFRRDLYGSIDRAMTMHGIDYIPGSVELGDFDATSTTIAVNPGGELDRLPQPALARTFDRYWEEFVARRSGENDWKGYTPYEWRVVGTFVQMGQPERARQALEWFFTHSRPESWNHWAEVVFRDPATPEFIGDMPHTWVGSDFIRSILDMFAHESGDALVLAAAVPLEWLDGGEEVGVEMLRTRYGPLSWSMKSEDESVVVHIEEGLNIPPGGIIVVSPIDRRETVVRELPAEIRFSRSSGGQ